MANQKEWKTGPKIAWLNIKDWTKMNSESHYGLLHFDQLRTELHSGQLS